MKDTNKNTQTAKLSNKQPLFIDGVSGSNFRLAMYALTKIGMFYCIFNTEWLALSGFTIATIYTYIDMMSND